jgi:hypothetical protein
MVIISGESKILVKLIVEIALPSENNEGSNFPYQRSYLPNHSNPTFTIFREKLIHVMLQLKLSQCEFIRPGLE